MPTSSGTPVSDERGGQACASPRSATCMSARRQKHPYRELFGEIAQNADVLALCGDLTNLGAVKEAEILAEDLAACPIPKVGVLGNHDYECDCVDEVATILQQAGLQPARRRRRREIDGVSFVGAKGFAGGFGRHLLASFGEAATKAFVAEGVQEAIGWRTPCAAPSPTACW